MHVEGVPRRTIWLADDGWSVCVLDQTRLPHEVAIERLYSVDDVWRAIRDMHVRGAPLIGVTAAYGVALAMHHDPSDAALAAAIARLATARPTAVNLPWALEEMRRSLAPLPAGVRARAAHERAAALTEGDVAACRAIGAHGLELIRAAAARTGRRVEVLTHCNAGWLAVVDWGTALAPVYMAHRAGIPVHVWTSETRPRNQGLLTAWELAQEGVPHTIVADNAAGHLMQHGRVDLCIVGTDRTTARGDVCNKVGTYLKALGARAHDVPFYVALPRSSFDASIENGRDVPIEERDALEVTTATGQGADGRAATVILAPSGSPAANPAFDVTPAELVTGFITDGGIVPAAGLRAALGR